jgi:hypothetical protein
MEENWNRYKDLLKQAQLKTEMSRPNTRAFEPVSDK